MVNTSSREECVRLRKLGYTLPRIVNMVGLSKSTVYFHIADIPLSKERKSELLKLSASRITSFNHTRFGKSRVDRHPRLFSTWTPAIVNLLGHLMFDGQLERYACIFTNSNHVLLDHVRKLMKLVYDFPPQEIESSPGVFRISYCNVELGTFMLAKSKELREKILYMNIDLQKAFLSAFFDDEGSVYFISKRRAVRGYQHDIPMLKIIQKLLARVDINSRIDEKYKEIIISRKSEIQKFANTINFMPGLCVNGNRSNSVWKESLEKREILRRALASYE